MDIQRKIDILVEMSVERAMMDPREEFADIFRNGCVGMETLPHNEIIEEWHCFAKMFRNSTKQWWKERLNDN